MPLSLREETSGSRINYYLLHAHVVADGGGEQAMVRLTVEDLSSGEKRIFASVVEFSRFLNRLTDQGDERWAPPADA